MVERITKIYPAWDRRDPNPSKDYGIHGAEYGVIWRIKVIESAFHDRF